ncbi:hypothetical protein LIER_21750 [Lithospermum erythrorhizon]|uniref:Reverse transcriptase domain-containing protein n=1 Tax=Lithospermum erythrorhizon TaxID=34254 RepID=A0AAV3QVH7_LITER
MCTDFTNLNKACPKDYYPLPCLGRVVDGSARHEVFDFLDASRGYHQDAGASYQRKVNQLFKDQIGRNMEIYVDDMLVKSRMSDEHLENFKETLEAFEELKGYLGSPKLLTRPEGVEELQLYLAVSEGAPIKRIMSNPSLTGRLTTWAIELSEFEISYSPRTSIKTQTLADFIVECTARIPEEITSSQEGNLEEIPGWKLYVDGASNEKGSGVGILI